MQIDVSYIHALFQAQPLLALLVPVAVGFLATLFAKVL